MSDSINQVHPSSDCLPPWWHELDDLPHQWKLVSCNGKKTPIDPKTGHPLSNWPTRCIPVEEFKILPPAGIQAVGVALGPASGGLLAVDFDAEGYEAVFQGVYGRPVTDLPNSVSWSSGKPGRKQVAFSVPEHYWGQLRNRKSWSNPKETCLELRWDRHQSVFLGAHPETNGYKWWPGCSPRELQVAEAPAWLLVPLMISQSVVSPVAVKKEDDGECERARTILDSIPPRDDYEGWLKVGMALHSVDDSLLEDWIDWSRGSSNFDEQECNEKWKTFNRQGVTMGTLLYMANKDAESQPFVADAENKKRKFLEAEHRLADDMTVEEALNDLIRLYSQRKLNVEKLLPQYLRDSMSIIRETIEYEWSVMLLVLLAGLSGALPLNSSIELIPGDFQQSMNLLACLLMETGEAKSPLINRLVATPWKISVDVVMKKRYQDSVRYWKSLKEESSGANDEFNIPRPDPVNTLITEDLTTQGVERHLVLHDRYAKGSVLLLFDEGKDLLSAMAGQISSPKETMNFGTWILSRYDGTGARGAKADATKERHYSQCRVAALICCQPDIYRQITGDSDQSGLAGRFVVVEQTTVAQHFPEEFDPSHQLRHQMLTNVLGELYSYVCDRQQISLMLSEEARRMFQKERKHLDELKNNSLSDAERGQLNKAHGRLGRLAGILHLLWSFDPARPQSRHLLPVVSVETMQRAIELNRYFLSSSVLVRQTSSGNSRSMQLIEAFHKRALKVKKVMKVSEIRKALQSDMRATPAETELIVAALNQIGVGKCSRDERGTLCYQALRPLG